MIGRGPVGWKKRNKRLIAGVGVTGKFGKGRGDPRTRLGRRVEGCEAFCMAKRVMAGSEAQFLDDEAYAAKLVTPSLR